MIKINMREFTRHIAEYMDRADKGERFIIVKRNRPIAEIQPYNPKKTKPGWSLEMPKKIVKGLSLSEEFIKYRRQERS